MFKVNHFLEHSPHCFCSKSLISRDFACALMQYSVAWPSQPCDSIDTCAFWKMEDCITLLHLLSRDTFEGIFVCLFVWWCGGGYTKSVEKCFERALRSIHFVLLCCISENVFWNMHVLCVDLYASSDTFEVIFSTPLPLTGWCMPLPTPNKEAKRNTSNALRGRTPSTLVSWFACFFLVDYLQ